jgi:capsular exopolysaccharide synthesis family protein
MSLLDKLMIKSRIENPSYIISKEKPLSFVAESFQKVVLNLESANIDGKLKTIQVTSTLPGEGKSTLISNLSYILQKNNHQVIILDLDFRKPTIHRIFESPNQKGIVDYLVKDNDLDDFIQLDETTQVSYMVTGRKTNLISNILNSNKLKSLIDKLKQRYDYVLLDTPPVTSISDALYISKLSDGVIFVIGQDQAKKTLIKDAVISLKQQKANIIGAVLTQLEKTDMPYGYAYYHAPELKKS